VSTDAYLALGSNLGDRLATIDAALLSVGALPGTAVVAASPVYESEPWGVTEQPPFANAVARVSTSLRADQLLGHLQEIEISLGRRRGVRFGPRAIDIDILLFGDEEWTAPELTIPHPRLMEREFVVRPLLDVWPDAMLPDGTAITLDSATEGRVTGVLRGREATEWVEVAMTPGRPGKRWVDMRLLFLQSVLEVEGIPVAWDPFPPTEDHNPWGLPRKVSLLVPAADAERARRVITEAESAPPEFPDEG
jgi:2-amino-4-hydroxy-6-hydroxymethyldihydropteridine diphosphokinase